MSNILFIDTETTGLPGRLPAPRLVQLAAVLYCDDGRELDGFDCLIKPDGWTVPDAAAAIHGFTTEECNIAGIRISHAMETLIYLRNEATIIAAHNLQFDRLIIDGELSSTHGLRLFAPHHQSFCTMLSTTNVVKIPSSRGYKWPKLAEAYRFFFERDFEGAHDARADVRACADIYFELKRRTTPKSQGGEDAGR